VTLHLAGPTSRNVSAHPPQTAGPQRWTAPGRGRPRVPHRGGDPAAGPQRRADRRRVRTHLGDPGPGTPHPSSCGSVSCSPTKSAPSSPNAGTR